MTWLPDPRPALHKNIFTELTEKYGKMTVHHQDGDHCHQEHQDQVGEEYDLSSSGDPHLTGSTAAGPGESKAPHDDWFVTNFSCPG